jgi:K+-transporting ATPase ATPase A chain
LTAWLQFAALLAALAAVTKPLGRYMARVYAGRRTLLHPILRPVEVACYRLAGVREDRQQRWTSYAASVLAFGLVGVLSLYALLRLQGKLGLNPQAAVGMSPDLAFNTAVSFVTNTSWQSYSGEVALGYLAQMLGIAVQSFLSMATSMAVAAALFRGMVRDGDGSAKDDGKKPPTIGNFWVDLTRSVVYIILPLSVVAAVALAGQGVIQNFSPYVAAHTLEPGTQTIAQGPVASQEAIKLLSSDGGGFFNVTSEHPYENPTPFSNLFSMFLMLVVPAAFTYTFGRMIRDTRQGWALFIVMALLFTMGFAAMIAAEQQPTDNWEGKEARFGIAGSALFAEASTATSSGAMNSAHGSFRPLGTLVQLVNMHTGEVVFGGPGCGMYSMIPVVLLTVFIAGLMVGRTPEYLGKRIERFEVQMVALATILTSSALLLLATSDLLGRFPVGSAWNPPGAATANFSQQGAHGFSEALYAFTSAVANNGSAMAGLNANTPWYNLLLGLGMLAGRYLIILPVLAIAGSLARKRRVIAEGSMPTHGPVFVALLTGMILLLTAITYLPAFFLGPIAEYFTM